MSWKKHFTAYGTQGSDSMKPSSASRFQSKGHTGANRKHA